MATGKIGKRAVDALETTGAKHFLWDDELRGFGVQVTPAGVKSYVYQYRLGGREAAKKRYTIGRHGSPWTPATARSECERLALLVGQGIDPVGADQERRRVAVDLSFKGYVTTFTNGYLKKHWKDWARAESLLKREPTELLGDRAMPSITRGDLVAVLDRYDDRPSMARQAYATLRKMFAWAEGRGDIDRTPIGTGFPAPRVTAARDRTLDDCEIKLAWAASAEIPFPFGPAYRMLFATAARRDEVSGMSWAELDRAKREWTLPADRSKNGLPHIVPLNEVAIAILDAVVNPSQSDDEPKWPKSGLVFTTTGKTPISGHSKAKRRLDEAMARLQQEGGDDRALAAWRVHDIRRTVATGLQRLGVRFEVTEAVLNHVSGSKGGVAGVYQRHSWKDEKRAALEAWGKHLRSLLRAVSHDDVVKIGEGRAA